MVLEKVDYKKVLYYFEEISKIPRGSRNNKGISDYLVKFAEIHNLPYRQDELLNVLIMKEAAKGYELCPSVILQGHMDMVCEKNHGTKHDFLTDGLNLKVDGDFIYAKGTTLGGDDGIAVAYALAILDDTSLLHPRLEVMITTDEEIGMEGAARMDCHDLKASYMINIDSEEEGVLLAGCAGGMTTACRLPLCYEKRTGRKLMLFIGGLQGGHSGVDIDKNRTNANVLIGRFLFDLRKEDSSFAVTEMYGGSKDNAIPREAFAGIVIEESEKEKMVKLIESLEKKYKKELSAGEPDFFIQAAEEEEKEYEVFSENTLEQTLTMLLFSPNGIQTMSSQVKDLVESSLNLGILKIFGEQGIFSYSVRSSLTSYKDFLGEKLAFLIQSLGGTCEITGSYPAWEYKENSPLREICGRVFQEQYGYEPQVLIIHAGLECGILADKMKDVDIVSMGPDVFDIHTPKERMSISSVKRVYDYILGILERICRETGTIS